ncbi:MAG: sigma 54-interacting transcriptional regulator [Acidobacteria bacterium]|nr:sigma 54-interacting transcriptional regulator [Acidobacteriota bacterium]
MLDLGEPQEYVLQELLGEGRSCSVYKALDPSTRKSVALKFVKPALRGSGAETALQAEFLLLSRLSHPNLLRTFGLRHDPNAGPVLVLEFFPGSDIRAVRARVTPDHARSLLVQLCRALGFLHARGLVHGDLKPENILIQLPTSDQVESDGTVTEPALRLIDLGFATTVAQNTALPRRGTLPYAAPEILAGLPADQRVDLFALGHIIADFFPALSSNAVAPLSLPTRSTDPLDHLPPHLAHLVRELTDPDPRNRPTTVADVIDALREGAVAEIPYDTPSGIRSTFDSSELPGRGKQLARLLDSSLRLKNTSVLDDWKPSVFLIQGEAGSGKSRLMDALQAHLTTVDIPLVRISCTDSVAIPFQPFQVLLDRLTADSRCDPSHAPLPIAMGALDDYTNSPPWARDLLLRRLDSVAESIARQASARSMVLVLEDVHAATEDSLALFQRLLPRALTSPFVLIATARTGPPFDDWIVDARTTYAGSPRLLHMTVDPLTTDETRDFLERSLGPCRELSKLADTLSAITKGNPRFLMETLAQLSDNGVVSGGPFRWRVRHDTLHEHLRHSSLRSLVSTRLESVPASDTPVLDWLSILGEPATISLIHQASGLPLLELRRSLQDLVAVGVLRCDSSELESRFSFSHDVYRDAVYGRLSADRKASLHRSIGVALERLWGEPNDARCLPIAFHFVRGHCSSKGPKYALAAATWAHRQGAAHQAISSYLDVLNLIPDEETDRRCHILERTAVLLRQIGDLRRAESCYLEILLCSRRTQDSDREALALAHLGRLGADRGNLRSAEAYALKALRVQEANPAPRAAAEAYLVLGTAAHKSGDFSGSLGHASRAGELARVSGDKLVTGLALNLAGLARMGLRRYADAFEDFRSWFKIAEEVGDIVLRTVAQNNIGWVLLERGDLDAAEREFEACLRATDAGDLECCGATAAINAGETARLRGAFSLSRRRFSDALHRSRKTDLNEVTLYLIYSIALLDLEEGFFGESVAQLGRVLESARSAGMKSFEALALNGLGECSLQCGRASEALEYFKVAMEIASALGDTVVAAASRCGWADALSLDAADTLPAEMTDNTGGASGLTAWRSALQSRAASAGWEPQAGLLIDQAASLAEVAQARTCMVRSGISKAWLALVSGNTDRSLATAKHIIELCDQCGLRPDRAEAFLITGIALSLEGRYSEARAALEACRDSADEIGLATLRARSRAVLADVASILGKEDFGHECLLESAAIIKATAKSLPDLLDRQRFLAVSWRRRVLECVGSITLGSSELGETVPNSMDVGDASSSDRRTKLDLLPEVELNRRVTSEVLSDSNQSKDFQIACERPSTSGIVMDLTSPTKLATSLDPPDLRTTITHLLEESLRAIACDRGMVFLIAPDGSTEIVVARGLENESIQDARSYCRTVIDRAAQGEEILVVDTARDERYRDRHSVSLFQIVSIVCVPLKFGHKVTGALYLDSRAGGRLLREEDLRAARAMAARMTGSIRVAWDRDRQREEALLRQKQLCQIYRLDAILGDSAVMKKTYRVLEAVIASDCNVLVTGESGTGKELAARAIHFSGRRKMAPFVTVDCGALPDTLVESELFGYRKGAFTGAEEDKRGLFEEADGGTLFLDEITNTTTLFQSKLLRVLQTGELRRIGDTTPRKVDVRIVAATNTDLERAVQESKFREDLFYRLNVVTVKMPPLRERAGDAAALAEQFARAFCEKEKIAYRGIGESALRRIREHAWPGNVRELKNAVESALVLSRDGAVRREFLPESLRGGSYEEIRDLLSDPGPGSAGEPAPEAGSGKGWLTEDELRKVSQLEERARIVDALARAAGDKSLAASILGCSRMTLYRRMQKLGIDYRAGRD